MKFCPHVYNTFFLTTSRSKPQPLTIWRFSIFETFFYVNLSQWIFKNHFDLILKMVQKNIVEHEFLENNINISTFIICKNVFECPTHIMVSTRSNIAFILYFCKPSLNRTLKIL